MKCNPPNSCFCWFVYPHNYRGSCSNCTFLVFIYFGSSFVTYDFISLVTILCLEGWTLGSDEESRAPCNWLVHQRWIPHPQKSVKFSLSLYKDISSSLPHNCRYLVHIFLRKSHSLWATVLGKKSRIYLYRENAFTHNLCKIKTFQDISLESSKRWVRVMAKSLEYINTLFIMALGGRVTWLIHVRIWSKRRVLGNCWGPAGCSGVCL